MCILYTVYPPLVLDTDGGHPPPPLPCSTADVRPIFKAVSGVLSSYFNTKVSCFIFGEPHSGSKINVFIIVWRDDPLIMFDREVCFVGNFFRFFFLIEFLYILYEAIYVITGAPIAEDQGPPLVVWLSKSVSQRHDSPHRQHSGAHPDNTPAPSHGNTPQNINNTINYL